MSRALWTASLADARPSRRRRMVVSLAARLAALGLLAGAAVTSSISTAVEAAAATPRTSQAAASAVRTASAAGTASTPKEGDVRGHRRILIVRYRVASTCTVVANYPLNPGNRQWAVPAGATINWRYNVTNRVAAVSMPGSQAFPRWGFVTDRGCIGRSVGQVGHYQVFHNGHWVTKRVTYPAGRAVPNRLMSGRSQFAPYWRSVDWRPSHGAVPTAQLKMTRNATLRDAPNRFVIGNVYAGWHVRPTSEHRNGMTKVYVPALHRWGWAQIG